MLSHVWLFVTPSTEACQASLSPNLPEFAQIHVRWVSDAILTISSSAVFFSFCFLSFPPSGSLPMSWLFVSGGQSNGVLSSASVLPMNIQCWFPLGLTGLISLLSRGLSRVFSSTTIRKQQFFGDQPSFWSNSHIATWLLKKPLLLVICSVMSDSLWPHGLLHTRLPYPSPSPRVCSNSCPLSW